MSNVNIRRAVENIRANTTVYTPLVEVIVNAIQAIESAGISNGKVIIRVRRSSQLNLDDSLPDIQSFEVEDNGIGFTDENRDSFDTLYSDLKIQDGGKGFGRFTCLKYFEHLHVDSVYQDGDRLKRRKFSMGKGNDIIVNEATADTEETSLRTMVKLDRLKPDKTIDKKLLIIARNLAEKLLPYFITDGYSCPTITIAEENGSDSITLNDLFTNELSAYIVEIPVSDGAFTLTGISGDEEFFARVFKLYSPKNQKSKINLIAHKREVTSSPIHNYITEFVDEFFDKGENGSTKNYIIKACVFSPYLDRNVSLERGGFEFQTDNDLIYGISQSDIERQAANIAKSAAGLDIHARQEKKKERVISYVDGEAPWHKHLIGAFDFNKVHYKASNEDIEAVLQREKFAEEIQIRREVANLLTDNDSNNLRENAAAIVTKISDTSKNDLIHYVALRRNILDIFSKSLQVDENGKYSSEGLVHDIIFPRKGNTDSTPFEDHNLWIIDERLNFTSYVSSDTPLNGGNTERTDLIVYNKRVLFRGDNEASNPIIIFEFKKPQRDDFVNPSSHENPIQQVIRYVNSIREGKYKTPEGRKILVTPQTPFYGYVICDLTSKVENWLELEEDFTPMPDRQAWFKWRANINLYIEVISWDKLLKDAKMRNQIFFTKLGI